MTIINIIYNNKIIKRIVKIVRKEIIKEKERKKKKININLTLSIVELTALNHLIFSVVIFSGIDGILILFK